MPVQPVERKLAAIFAADIAGYSRLMARDEVRTLTRLKAYRVIIDRMIASHRGRIFNTAGDSVVADFASAVDAVQCAVAVQAAIAAEDAGGAADEPMQLRIGVHVGDVMVDGDNLLGDGVNIAARLEALAEPGAICVSAAARDHIGNKLPFGFDDLGDQQVKNIPQPIRAYRVQTGKPALPLVTALPLPDKPSIAVLPFQNMSGDPEQEYFVDGIVEDIITELSRFRGLFVIARNSTFTYKGTATDVRQVASELGVRYVVDGSIRKAGDRVRVTAQLIDIATGNHLWAERYDRALEDVFAVQEEVTRCIVAAVAPSVELAEVAHARRASRNNDAVQLTWRAQGLLNDALLKGQPPLMLEAIAAAQQAIAADPALLSAYYVLGRAHRVCHLYRWGPEPKKALDAAWSVAERMLNIDALDERTLTQCGHTRVMRGDYERGIADLRRAIEVNPNSVATLRVLEHSQIGRNR